MVNNHRRRAGTHSWGNLMYHYENRTSSNSPQSVPLVRALLLACALAVTSMPISSHAEGDAINVRMTDSLRFAIALVQDMRTYSEPGVYDSDSHFEMPILSPHQIVDERTVAGELWYLVERREGRTTGWVPANLVAVWNSRHALKPNAIGAEGTSIPGYCEASAVDDAVMGESRPCMTFLPAILDRAADRAPFPVLGVEKKKTRDGVEMLYFHVLAPTLYSNIAPIVGSGEGVRETTRELGEVAKTLELIILIDATGSMRDEIKDSAEALTGVVSQLAREEGVTAKFMVLAYRDTDGASSECPAMSGTVDSRNRLAFTSAGVAETFLLELQACEGGDAPEAIWDALYLLKDIEVTKGARRALILAGDAPALSTTRGMTFFGTTVPRGIDRTAVFRAVETTIGHSTSFLGLLAQERVRETAEEIMGGFNLLDKTSITLERGTGAVKEHMLKNIQKSITDTKRDSSSILDCQRAIEYDETTAQVGLFCGDASDADLAARIRDLVDSDETVVVRHLWVPKDRNLDDVALVSRKEATECSAAMADLSDLARTDGTGCADESVGPDAWLAVIGRLVPGEEIHTSAGIVLSQPHIGAGLHKYWDLEVGAGDSIIKYQPATLAALGNADCKALGEKLREASSFMTATASMYTDMHFLWFPFDQLP